jgi:hypothetical protein
MKPTALIAAMSGLAIFVLAAPQCKASLSFVGNGYLELSTSQTSPIYYGVNNVTDNTGSGYNLGNLTSINQGQTLYLGGQIQTYTEQNGNATLFYRIGTSGSYSSINLAFYQQADNNNWWDSNGGINSNHTYYSVNMGSSLSSGSYTVDFYYSAHDTDNNITVTEGSSGTPYSFSFTVVPEPIRMALGMFGGLAVLWWCLGLCWKKPEIRDPELEESASF